jgi:hypothetical protein
MAKNTIGKAPFPPVVTFDMKELFSITQLKKLAVERSKGVTICLRYPEGPKDRGGYFFHFVPTKADTFSVYDFEKRHVTDLSAEQLVAFINHCTGQKFDEPSFILAQTELNFLKDE